LVQLIFFLVFMASEPPLRPLSVVWWVPTRGVPSLLLGRVLCAWGKFTHAFIYFSGPSYRGFLYFFGGTVTGRIFGSVFWRFCHCVGCMCGLLQWPFRTLVWSVVVTGTLGVCHLSRGALVTVFRVCIQFRWVTAVYNCARGVATVIPITCSKTEFLIIVKNPWNSNSVIHYSLE